MPQRGGGDTATARVEAQPSPRPYGSQFFGVSADLRRPLKPRFRAGLSFKGRSYYLGRFADIDAAARAHDAVARWIPGRPLNFPGAAWTSDGAEPSGGEAAGVPRGSWCNDKVRAAIAAVRKGGDTSRMPASTKPSWRRPRVNFPGAATAGPSVQGATRACNAAAATGIADSARDAPLASTTAVVGNVAADRVSAALPDDGCAPAAPGTLPPLTRADLLVLVRVRLRAARVDDSTVDLENVSESGLRAMLGSIATRLSLR